MKTGRLVDPGQRGYDAGTLPVVSDRVGCWPDLVTISGYLSLRGRGRPNRGPGRGAGRGPRSDRDLRVRRPFRLRERWLHAFKDESHLGS